MDFNKLYFEHQVLLIKARRPGTPQARYEHLAAAGALAGRIATVQHRLGANGADGWRRLSAPVRECAA